jgi:hypothetical protein
MARGKKLPVRDAHLSKEHLKDSVNLLNDLPSGKQMVNIPLQNKKAGSLCLPTSRNYF